VLGSRRPKSWQSISNPAFEHLILWSPGFSIAMVSESRSSPPTNRIEITSRCRAGPTRHIGLVSCPQSRVRYTTLAWPISTPPPPLTCRHRCCWVHAHSRPAFPLDQPSPSPAAINTNRQSCPPRQFFFVPQPLVIDCYLCLPMSNCCLAANSRGNMSR
jgi:hypothetical protein